MRARGIRSGKAGCRGCNAIGYARKVRSPETAGDASPCAHYPNSAAATAGAGHSAANADLTILLDWHMTASKGDGLNLATVSCSAQADIARLPIEDSEADEILARFRDGSNQSPNRSTQSR